MLRYCSWSFMAAVICDLNRYSFGLLNSFTYEHRDSDTVTGPSTLWILNPVGPAPAGWRFSHSVRRPLWPPLVQCHTYFVPTPALSRQIGWLKMEFCFKFVALALQSKWKLQSLLFQVSFLFWISMEIHFINPQGIISDQFMFPYRS